MVNLNIVLFQSLTGKAVNTNFRVVGLIRLKTTPHTTAPVPKTLFTIDQQYAKVITASFCDVSIWNFAAQTVIELHGGQSKPSVLCYDISKLNMK